MGVRCTRPVSAIGAIDQMLVREKSRLPFLGDGYLVGGVKPIICKNKPLGKVAQILLSSSTVDTIAELTRENYQQSKWEPEANRKKEIINI